MNFFIIIGTISKLLNRRLDKKIASARAHQSTIIFPRQETLFNEPSYLSADTTLTNNNRRETGT